MKVAKNSEGTKPKSYRKVPNSPVSLVVVNCDSASGYGAQHSYKTLQKAAVEADILLTCECFNLDMERSLGGFRVVQFGDFGSSASSCAVAIREHRGKIADRKLIFGAPGLDSHNVRARYWVQASLMIDDMAPRLFSAGHAQPKRAWILWAGYMRKAPKGVLGLDANKTRKFVQAAFPYRKIRQVDLLAAVIPRGIPCSKAIPIPVGGDHKAVKVILWPKIQRGANA